MGKEQTTNSNTDWLALCHIHSERMMHLSWEIQSYVEAFAMTGNNAMAGILREWAGEVSEAHEAMHKVAGLATRELVRQSENATRNMVMAALGMCTMGQGEAGNEKGNNEEGE
jgi:hypothetical protein